MANTQMRGVVSLAMNRFLMALLIPAIAGCGIRPFDALSRAVRGPLPIDDRPVLDHSRPSPPPDVSDYVAATPTTPEAPRSGLQAPAGQQPASQTTAREEQPHASATTAPALHRDYQDLRRRGLVADARAMLLEDWQKYRKVVQALHLGYACGVLQDYEAQVPSMRIANEMVMEQARAGVPFDSSFDPSALVKEWGSQVRDRVLKSRAACGAMSPADRARLRVVASTLISLP